MTQTIRAGDEVWIPAQDSKRRPTRWPGVVHKILSRYLVAVIPQGGGTFYLPVRSLEKK